MDSNPLLSIIIPVYKVENYIHQCVDSVLKQPFQDYELILVDDGSPDGCPAICDKYAAENERVRVIHQENGGLADARNSGINAASGEYLLFIDSDDYIVEDSLQKIADGVKSDCAGGACDVTFLRAYAMVYDKQTDSERIDDIMYQYDKNRLFKRTNQEVIEYFTNLGNFPTSAWIKLYRRKFVVEKNLYFTKGQNFEDLDQMLSLLFCTETFNCFEFPYYCYRVLREGAITANHSVSFEAFFSIIEKWYDAAYKPQTSFTIISILAIHYCSLLWDYYNVDKATQKAHKKKIKVFMSLLRDSKRRKFRLIYYISRVFGLFGAVQFIRLYYTVVLKRSKN